MTNAPFDKFNFMMLLGFSKAEYRFLPVSQLRNTIVKNKIKNLKTNSLEFIIQAPLKL